MGDLSGKFGTLDNYAIFKTSYNDTLLPLFGPNNLLGRSVIIHKQVAKIFIYFFFCIQLQLFNLTQTNTF